MHPRKGGSAMNAKQKIKVKKFKTAFQVLLASSFLHCLFANAYAVSTLTTKAASSDANQTLASRLSLDSGFEYSARVSQDERAKREQSMDITLKPSLKLTDNFTASIKTILTQENSGSQSTQASDTVVGLGIQGLTLSPLTKTTHSLYGIVPTSVNSRDQDRLKGAAGFSNGISYKDSYWEISYALGYTQYFHEFNLNSEGEANIERSLANSLGVQYNISEKLSLLAFGVYKWGQTYGTKTRTAYEIHSDLIYNLTSKIAMNIGTSSVGKATKSNGVDSNISAFDSNNGIARIGISLSL
jgi:hypothetical protein